jgi:hypothetical protein
MKPDEKLFIEVNCVALNGDSEFRCDFCNYIMTPVVYMSFCTAENALAVALESPPSRRGQPITQELSVVDRFFLLVDDMLPDTMLTT